MRTLTKLLLLTAAIGVSGCVYQTRLSAPMQPDGWQAQPLSIACRFAPDADLDPGTGTPVGDEGYSLYILTDTGGKRNYSTTLSVVFSFQKNPGGHSWILLESPWASLECGHNGNFGLEKLRYQEGVQQRFQDNHPNPIAYLWEVMHDGRLEIGRPDRNPTFVWRMPITQQRYQAIFEYVMRRKYDQFSLRDNNCVDMVTDAAALAGINLNHRLRLHIPPETKILGRRLQAWTDPNYHILEFSTPDVLQMDLIHLAQFGIGNDVTEWYLGLKQ